MFFGRVIMSIRHYALATVLALACTTASAQELKSPDAAIETSTSSVLLPGTVGGTTLVRGCVSCKPVTLTLDATTRFFVGKQQVSQADFNKLIGDGKPHSMTITYNQQARTMTRVSVRGPIQNARARK
jgi:hypothetical protein